MVPLTQMGVFVDLRAAKKEQQKQLLKKITIKPYIQFDNPYNKTYNLNIADISYKNTEETLLRLERMLRYQKVELTSSECDHLIRVFDKILIAKVEPFRTRNARYRIIKMINRLILSGPRAC